MEENKSPYSYLLYNSFSEWQADLSFEDSFLKSSILGDQLYSLELRRDLNTGKLDEIKYIEQNVKSKDIADLKLPSDNKNGISLKPPDILEPLYVETNEIEFNSLNQLLSSHKSSSLIEKSIQNLDLISDTLPIENKKEFDADKYLESEIDQSFFISTTKTEPNFDAIDSYTRILKAEEPIENFDQIVPELAYKFEYELDNFQKQAIYRLEQNESVFVTAHTSAGKTAVAEYAIALAEKHLTKVIYTSPIKALSNQKFHDFKAKFSDVGILTGDIQINPRATCLIMTTEILRSMLYREADLIRDVEFVIFDEIHYLNDVERGVVWEEVIIMLPEHITLVLLSATVPNATEFANWVGRTKRKVIFVISTLKRPVPLEYYLWVADQPVLIVDKDKNYLLQGYKDARMAFERANKKPTAAGKNVSTKSQTQKKDHVESKRILSRQKQRDQLITKNVKNTSDAPSSGQSKYTSSWSSLINYLDSKKLLPCVAFVFSRKRCEEYAETLSTKTLCAKAEKNEIHVFVERALARLNSEDRSLPQIRQIKYWLSYGVAVHHGGLLPIVKEIVEMLFSKGLVKVLFATETFAMGVNMPAKCVVFSSTRKHDGKNLRDLLPGECTQMSGRAGRRGLDKIGTVIIRCDSNFPDSTSLNHMLLGQPTKLISQFRLTYHMILSLLRVEMLRVEDMIQRSFSENLNQKMLPSHEARVRHLDEDIEQIYKRQIELLNFVDPHAITKWKNTSAKLLDNLSRIGESRKVFCPGRLIFFKGGSHRQLACIMSLNRGTMAHSQSQVECLILYSSDPSTYKPYTDPDDYLPLFGIFRSLIKRNFVSKADFKIEYIALDSIEYVTNTVIKINLNQLRRMSDDDLDIFFGQFDNFTNVQKEWADEFNWSSICDLDFHSIVIEKRAFEKLLDFEYEGDKNDFYNQYVYLKKLADLSNVRESLKQRISLDNLELLPNYNQRINVLRAMNFIDEKNNVLLKGRVACEIHSANELVLTELLFENKFADFEPEEIVSLLSSFIFKEKSEIDQVLYGHLEAGINSIKDIANNVSEIQEAYQVSDIQDEDIITDEQFKLMRVVYEWAKGMSFQKVMELTDVSEGSIVRTIIRLDELLRECLDGLRLIGNSNIAQKIAECRELIRRDVVWAPSLYM